MNHPNDERPMKPSTYYPGSDLWQKDCLELDRFMKEHWQSFSASPSPGRNRLLEAINYSLFSGGKRFRPLLAMAAGRALSLRIEQVLPWAAAIEFVHTYSLIHDDLPLMDDDDWRRGQPTAHKVYGDAMALLAGDGLLTESFALLSEHYDGEILGPLLKCLSRSSGARGMVAGQAMDIQEEAQTAEQMRQVHRLKTGSLIRASIEGAALIASCSVEQLGLWREFGEHLGLAFQIADDVEDFKEGKEEVSLASLVDEQVVYEELNTESAKALALLETLKVQEESLRELVTFNRERCLQPNA